MKYFQIVLVFALSIGISYLGILGVVSVAFDWAPTSLNWITEHPHLTRLLLAIPLLGLFLVARKRVHHH